VSAIVKAALLIGGGGDGGVLAAAVPDYGNGAWAHAALHGIRFGVQAHGEVDGDRIWREVRQVLRAASTAGVCGGDRVMVTSVANSCGRHHVSHMCSNR